MKEDDPLRAGKGMMPEHGGKDGAWRDRHGPGGEGTQGDDAQRHHEQHDQSERVEFTSVASTEAGFLPEAAHRRRAGNSGYFNRQDSPPKLIFTPARTVR